jgi:hypothetical protein
MINQDKWLNSLPNNSYKNSQEIEQLNHQVWENTIPKKNNNILPKKYFLMTTVLIISLLIVPFIKNKTRNLEKEISSLEAVVNSIDFNLSQAILDNEVITSPENIAKLAKEHLNKDLVYYKKSQIRDLNNPNKGKKEKTLGNNKKNFSESIKTQVKKKIENKKKEIVKLQEIYKNPKSLPGEIKIKVAKQIEEKKFELKNLYESPKDIITLKRAGNWGIIQVVKAFLGIPIIPGR